MCETMNDVSDTSSSPPSDALWQPVTVRWFLVVFGCCLGYAILRYHFAGAVAWSHFPLFILNKATSLAAVVFVACSYLIGRVIRWHNSDPRLKLVVIKFCGLMGFSLAAIHAFFSVCLLTPAYFAKFFDGDGRLNFVGESGLAVGVVALWALAIPAITTLPMMPKALGGIRWKRTQRMGYLCLSLIVAHMVVFGLKGWLAPEHWPWALPPISLLAVIAAAIPLVAKIWQLSGRRNVSAE
jgi:DMSO/TMAO reductase YedYZ heme-binding membrane subunit